METLQYESDPEARSQIHLTEGQHLQYSGWKSLSQSVKGFGGVMLRQIPVADFRKIAHFSGREVKTLYLWRIFKI